MPLIDLIPVGSDNSCSISENGTISFPKAVWQRLGWEVPCKIAVTYIAQPLTLLLRRAENDQPGFSLSYQNRQITSRSGVKITCSRFASYVLRTQVVLPIRGLIPTFPENGRYQLALMLQHPTWVTEDFSQAGLKQIANDVKGIYQLLDSTGSIIRIGEGAVGNRIREHLKDERFAVQVKFVQYLVLSDKDEASVMEKILIAQHETEFGRLPTFNALRA